MIALEAPTVPYWNWSAGVGEAGFASKGGRQVLGRGGFSIPGLIAGKSLWYLAFYLQSPFQAALARAGQYLFSQELGTANTMLCPHLSGLHREGAEALVLSHMHSVCRTD